jgi:hypothetical protein
LNLKKIGSFKIKRNIRNISFELKLSPIIRIYLVFYFSLLEPAHPNILKGLIPELDLKIQELVYDVKSILVVRKRRNKL